MAELIDITYNIDIDNQKTLITISKAAIPIFIAEISYSNKYLLYKITGFYIVLFYLTLKFIYMAIFYFGFFIKNNIRAYVKIRHIMKIKPCLFYFFVKTHILYMYLLRYSTYIIKSTNNRNPQQFPPILFFMPPENG